MKMREMKNQKRNTTNGENNHAINREIVDLVIIVGITIIETINKSFGSCALHSLLMRSIHPQTFITLASIVLEICYRQNSSMKINKGQ